MTTKIELFSDEHEMEFIRVISAYDEDFIAEARKLKGKFNTTKKSWDFPIKAKEKVEMAVYMIFGMSSDAASEKVNIELTFLESVHAAKSSVIIAGRIISKATSRDSSAEEGWGVTLTEGRIESGGSRSNWYTRVEANSVFEVKRVQKKHLKLLEKNKSVSFKIIE